MAEELSFIDKIRNAFDKMWAAFAKSTSVLVSSIFLVFSLGAIFGYAIAMLPGKHSWVLMVPPLLGVFAFYYRTFALVLFILFLIFIFI